MIRYMIMSILTYILLPYFYLFIYYIHGPEETTTPFRTPSAVVPPIIKYLIVAASPKYVDPLASLKTKLPTSGTVLVLML
jgi:hypothetical protein